MSYDLNFWKEKPGIKVDPQTAYERLSDGEWFDGLEELPIEQMLENVRRKFHEGWTQVDPLSWDAPNKAFQIYTTSQFFRVDCYGMTGNEMNAFIEIAAQFGCPLYDPQVGERFDGSRSRR